MRGNGETYPSLQCSANEDFKYSQTTLPIKPTKSQRRYTLIDKNTTKSTPVSRMNMIQTTMSIYDGSATTDRPSETKRDIVINLVYALITSMALSVLACVSIVCAYKKNRNTHGSVSENDTHVNTKREDPTYEPHVQYVGLNRVGYNVQPSAMQEYETLATQAEPNPYVDPESMLLDQNFNDAPYETIA